ETAGFDRCLLSSPLSVQQFPVVFAVVNCFPHCFDRNVVVLRNLLGTHCLSSEGLTVKYLGADPTADRQLLIARAALGLQELIADWLGHALLLPKRLVSPSHRCVL